MSSITQVKISLADARWVIFTNRRPACIACESRWVNVCLKISSCHVSGCCCLMTIFLSSRTRRRSFKFKNCSSKLFLATIPSSSLPEVGTWQIKKLPHIRKITAVELHVPELNLVHGKFFDVASRLAAEKKNVEDRAEGKNTTICCSKKFLISLHLKLPPRSCLITFDGETRRLALLCQRFELIYKSK